MKLKTVGLAPKVPAQAITTIVVAALAYFGVDLDAEVSAALGVIIGFGAGMLAPAAPTTLVPAKDGEAGQSLIPTLWAIFLILAIIVLIVWLI